MGELIGPDLQTLALRTCEPLCHSGILTRYIRVYKSSTHIPIHTNVNNDNLFIKVLVLPESLQPSDQRHTATPFLQFESTGWVDPYVEGRACLQHCGGGGGSVAKDDDDDDA